MAPYHPQAHCQDQQGFALPMVMSLGFVMLILGVTTMMVAQSDRTTSFQRKETNSSSFVTESGIARTLSQLTALNNVVLLTRNYDTINPETGTTYLGPDGSPNSGDEESTAVDEWTGYSPSATSCPSSMDSVSPSISLSGTMGKTKPNTLKVDNVSGQYILQTDLNTTGPDSLFIDELDDDELGDHELDTVKDVSAKAGQYTLKAYRYNSSDKTGTLLVQGQQGTSSSYIAVTMAIESVPINFPGVLASETLALRGRSVLGQNGNVYYAPDHSLDPSLTGFAAPSDSSRVDYLNAIYSRANDGPSGDRISGKIIACQVDLTLASEIPNDVTALGTIQGDISLSNAGSPYQIDQIDLDGNETITVDTTAGPVYLYYSGMVSLRGNAKILNIRTDGQPPKVGDLRIIADQDALSHDVPFILFDQACVSMAFLYNKANDLDLLTTGDGCPSSGDTNFDGVVWAEDIVSSVNIDPNTRSTPDGDDDHLHMITTNGSTTGIGVPDDVSSLNDIISSVGMTPKTKFGSIKNWKYVRF